jgi:hypothetical protein
MKLERGFLMSIENKILIKDSCILFDMLDLGLLDQFFLLEFKVFTTSLVISEINNEKQLSCVNPYILNKKLEIDSHGTFESMQELYVGNPGLSYADCSVLELAKRKDGVILSADKSLRKIAIKSELKVKGMLWIIRQLVENEQISIEVAIEKLKLYPQINSRVPHKEISELINHLTASLI